MVAHVCACTHLQQTTAGACITSEILLGAPQVSRDGLADVERLFITSLRGVATRISAVGLVAGTEAGAGVEEEEGGKRDSGE